MTNSVKVRILLLSIVIFGITGCGIGANLPFIGSEWKIEHQAKITAQADAKYKVVTDQLVADYHAQQIAAQKVNDNKTEELKQAAVIKQAEDSYVFGIYDIAYDQTVSDEAARISIQILATYAKKCTVPLTPEQSAAVKQLVIGLVSKDLTHQAQAKAQLEAKDQVVQAAITAKATADGKSNALQTALDTSTNKLTGMTGLYNQVGAKFASALEASKATIAKYNWLKATLISIAWCVGLLVLTGAVLAGLALILPPPEDAFFIALSKSYRFVMTHALKIIFMPVHWIYDLIIKHKTIVPMAPSAPIVTVVKTTP